MHQRFALKAIEQARLSEPVTLLVGPRGAGKATIARAAAAASATTPAPHDAAFLTLDHARIRAAARSDPRGFLADRAGHVPLVIAEIGQAPALLRALSDAVGADRRPGRYIVTSSFDVLSEPDVARPYPSAIASVRVWPLAQCELGGIRSDFVERAFRPEFPVYHSPERRPTIVTRTRRGGYPQAVGRDRPGERETWFGEHLTTVVEREITSRSAIEDPVALVGLLRAIAGRPSEPRNYASLANATGASPSTVTRHVGLLADAFLVTEIPAWSAGDRDSGSLKGPKLLLADSGLAGYLQPLHADTDPAGLLLQTFVGGELHKLATWAYDRPVISHFRDKRGAIVHFVLERRNHDIVGITVSSNATVTAGDFRGLRRLAELGGERFVRGIVLYCGSRTIEFGPRLLAVPVGALGHRLAPLSASASASASASINCGTRSP